MSTKFWPSPHPTEKIHRMVLKEKIQNNLKFFRIHIFTFQSCLCLSFLNSCGRGPRGCPPPLRTCPQLIYVILLTPSLTSELKEAGIIWQNIWFYFFINIPKTLNCKKVSFVVFQYGGTQYEWSSSLKRFPPKFSSKKYKKGNNH